jgi:ATP-dependent protease ClpP protease subunit
MKGIINIFGDIGSGPFNTEGSPIVELVDVIAQVERQKQATEFTVYIKSLGGLVETGDQIFDYLKSLGKPITTFADTECASIATKIFLAGSIRIIKSSCFFMIHNPWGGNMGDADELIQYGKDLKKIENRLVNEYAQLTGTSVDSIAPLMKQETILTPEQAVDLGFATEIATVLEKKAVAYTNKFNIKNPKMAKEAITKDEVQGMFASFGKDLKKFFKKFGASALTLTTSTGSEIEFPDVAAGESPDVGDSALVDGSPIPDGEHTIDGNVYVFAGGKVKSIDKSSNADGEEMQALKDENATLTQQVQTLQTQLATAKTQKSDAEKAVNKLKKNYGKLQKLAGNFDFGGKKKKNEKGAKAKKKSGETRQILRDAL